jgi:ribonuclease R
VSRVDLDGRRIDFRLMRDGEPALIRNHKDKGMFADEDLQDGLEKSAPTGFSKRNGRRGTSDSVRAPKSPIHVLKDVVKKTVRKATNKSRVIKPKRRT